MRVKGVHFLILIFLSIQLQALGDGDSLSTATTLIATKKYHKAEKLLKVLHNGNPYDLNTAWLYGQVAWWSKHLPAFKRIYSEAVQRFPENMYLKLDYALKLLENGDIDEADNLLDIYSAYDPTAADVLLAKAKIQFWQGNYDSALRILDSKSLGQEKTIEANRLRQDIYSSKSVWLEFSSFFRSDDQPLQSLSSAVSTGMYFHKLVKPYLSVSIPVFFRDSITQAIQSFSIGNKFGWIKPKIEVNFNAGIAHLPDNSYPMTFDLEVSKTTFRHLLLFGQVARLPYLITKASIETRVIPYHYFVSAGWDRSGSWNGKLSAGILHFSEDNNSVYSLTGWIFTPPIKFSSLRFSIGYAYGFGTSDECRYSNVNSLNYIESHWTAPIEGIYDPYFTPVSQNAHSALLRITYDPGKAIKAGFNANVGFWGSTQVPYLFLDNNQGESFINHGYVTTDFQPDEISAFVLYKLSDKITFKAEYAFLRNTFYTSHTAGITIKMNFFNDPETK